MDNFADEFKNVDGQNINIEKIGEDLDKDYTFLYENYIKNKKRLLKRFIKQRSSKILEVN